MSRADGGVTAGRPSPPAAIDRGTLLQLVLGILIALWEFSLGIYLVVKGFKPSPITAGIVSPNTRPAPRNTGVR